ncbi:MAG TPA: glycerol-3-phosphate acyltransferase [Dehalococcoidales bacterium]|nr:glycerol-3-phosphate acyltransferase [Dehalococcoidales bacterium]
MVQSMLCIPLGYFIGSINGASIIAWLIRRIDMRKEPDGRASAAEVYQKLGLVPFLLVVLLDSMLSMSAVLLSNYFSQGNLNIMMLTGLAALAGHNWSIFMKFKGGQGATSILGILIALITWQLFVGLLVGAISMFFTRKPRLSTIICLSAISITLFFHKGLGILPAYPLLLLSVMLLKRFQIKRIAEAARE